ncbi:hypothetical protein TPHA_0B04880 [Tetrapisispora phaffii CBS 4417]|uniref:peptidylprolyl isomerase n=1 Tax=Tetrapisispora phaffii (strain ATCC 24235 / CBS 4417 / NBRC 1672 / NRRL Y-8282 / UCD 70-5) TaxID=1071381 RepID=G8BQ76_TETPH|nr:hypothetical protein TPHA_0B04880 [Tetrapisispora phaffii CBS 4417]CCE62157.1 hypothetical protein TPHA_0B04880 [Tetrapisispora phaffii CBS 4417]
MAKLQVLLTFLFCLITSIQAYDRLENLEIGILKRAVPKGEDCEVFAKPGDKISVHYTGYLRETNEKFDSSLDRGTPLQFTLGTGQVIQGWDQGLVGMCVGESRKIQIPSALGYGSRAIAGVIPADSDLTFECELVDVESI